MPINSPTKPVNCIKSLPIDAKSATGTGNRLCCVPSVTGVLDSYDDVILPGAFVKKLPAFLRRGFNPMSHGWTWEAIVGYPVVAYEQGNQLYSEFEFHSDQQSQDALTKCRERLAAGLEVGLSVGFSVMPGQYEYFDNGPALLKWCKSNGYDMALFDVKGITAHNQPCAAIVEVEDLYEYSLTPVPANVQAMAVAVKSMATRGKPVALSLIGSNNMPNTLRLRTICGARDLKLASADAQWSPTGAISRIKKLTGAVDAPNADFAKAFTLVQGPNDDFESYHLPIADVVDGKLCAVPKAIKAAGDVLNGTRSGVELKDEDRESAMRYLETYFDKMDETAPWNVDKSTDAVPMWRGQYLGNYVEYSMALSAVREASYALHSELGDAMLGRYNYKDMSPSEIDDCISGMFAEHKDLCCSIVNTIRAGKGAESAEEAVKSADRAMLAMVSTVGLGSGLAWDKHARVAVDALRMMADRARERAAVRSKTDRTLSVANREILRTMCTDVAKSVEAITELLAATEPIATVDAESAALLDEYLLIEAEAALIAA